MWLIKPSVRILPLMAAWMLLFLSVADDCSRTTTVVSALQQHQPPSTRGRQEMQRHHNYNNYRRQSVSMSSQKDGALTATAVDVVCDDRGRRAFLGGLASATATISLSLSSFPRRASARAPGSKDVQETVQQIRDAARDLRILANDWDEKIALIDDEGHAVSGAATVARRTLGGVAPLSGESAIEVAKNTPLYRIDGAFTVIRKACLESDDDSWSSTVNLEVFEDLVERILFAVQKADGDLYSVAFAQKGTKQIRGIYQEAKLQIDQGIVDLDKMITLLAEAGAPGS